MVNSTTGWMIAVPLSDGATVSPGGILEKGFSAYLKDKRACAPDVPIIFVTPKPWATSLVKRKISTTILQ